MSAPMAGAAALARLCALWLPVAAGAAVVEDGLTLLQTRSRSNGMNTTMLLRSPDELGEEVLLQPFLQSVSQLNDTISNTAGMLRSLFSSAEAQDLTNVLNETLWKLPNADERLAEIGKQLAEAEDATADRKQLALVLNKTGVIETVALMSRELGDSCVRAGHGDKMQALLDKASDLGLRAKLHDLAEKLHALLKNTRIPAESWTSIIMSGVLGAIGGTYSGFQLVKPNHYEEKSAEDQKKIGWKKGGIIALEATFVGLLSGLAQWGAEENKLESHKFLANGDLDGLKKRSWHWPTTHLVLAVDAMVAVFLPIVYSMSDDNGKDKQYWTGIERWTGDGGVVGVMDKTPDGGFKEILKAWGPKILCLTLVSALTVSLSYLITEAETDWDINTYHSGFRY